MLPVGVFLWFETWMVCQNHMAGYQHKLFLNNLPADNSTRSSFPLAETKELESSALPAHHSRWPLCMSFTPGKQHQGRQAVPTLHGAIMQHLSRRRAFQARQSILAHQVRKVELCPQGVSLCTQGMLSPG